MTKPRAINVFARPYKTLYYDKPDLSKPAAAMGYAASFEGARRSLAVHIVLGDYPLAVVVNRNTGHTVTHMRGVTSGINIKDQITDEDRRLIAEWRAAKEKREAEKQAEKEREAAKAASRKKA